MGLIASQGRLLLLFARKSDLELRGQMICNRRQQLATRMERVAKAYADALSNTTPSTNPIPTNTVNPYAVPLEGGITPELNTMYSAIPQTQQSLVAQSDRLYTEDDAVASALYEAASAIIQSEDKKLELELKNLDTQHKTIETEIDSVQKVIDKNIERSFKIFS